MGHLVCQADLNLKLPASLGCYTRFSSTCMEPDFLHSLFLPMLGRKGKSKERGNERNLPLSNLTMSSQSVGMVLPTHDEMELTSECKGPPSLANFFGSEIYQRNLKTNYMVHYCLGSGLPSLPHCSAPTAMGELLVKVCKISRLQNVTGPRDSTSQTYPTQAAHWTHVSHRLFQWMSSND